MRQKARVFNYFGGLSPRLRPQSLSPPGCLLGMTGRGSCAHHCARKQHSRAARERAGGGGRKPRKQGRVRIYPLQEFTLTDRPFGLASPGSPATHPHWSRLVDYKVY